jgi:hypothetical protein
MTRLAPPPLSHHPVDVGTRTEAAILGELVRRGYHVLLPWGVNHRYDLVLDMGDRFLRAQCKTGRLRAGVISFNVQSVRSNTRGVMRRPYTGEIEVFLVHCPGHDRIYAVPVEEAATSTEICLRLTPTKNGQARRIRWARDFELPA